jgi:LuxR family maltose regulon positive regulatory protein
LYERLHQPASSLLTLIVAPPGFGKTTLATQWAQSPSGASAAWLSVDEDDDEVGRFLGYVVAALGHVYPQVTPNADALLAATAAPTPRAVITALLNDIATCDAPVALVIDDYHQIKSPAIHDLVTWLLEHMPANFRLLIATRIDPPLPLSRLRARGQLTEIRVADLRFTLDESIAFFAAMGLTLNQADIASLEGRTEGWVAGLQMAALSLSGRDEAYRHQFVAAFTGSHRHILDYLADEVLERQPEPVLLFLLQTAILNHLTAPLCDAVTGQHDGEAMLTYAEQANLFVVALDEERQWYRYHHLFADVLRHRLNRQFPERIMQLHLRASQWYEANHFYGDAISHAVAASAVDRAADLLETVSRELWTHRAMANMQSWLRLLPDSLIQNRPRLALLDAQLQLFRGQIATVEPRVRDAEVALSHSSERDQELENELIALKSMTENFRHGNSDGLKLAEQAADNLPTDHPLRGMALLNIAIAYWLRGDIGLAEEAFIRTQDACLAIGNTYQGQVAMAYRGQAALMRGRLQQAIAIYQAALDLTPERWELPDINGLFVGLGALRYEQDDLESAEHELERGTRLAEAEQNAIVTVGGLVFQSFIASVNHDTIRAQRQMKTALEIARQAAIEWVWAIPSLDARWSHWLLLHDDLETARGWAAQAERALSELPLLQSEANQLAIARVRIADNQPDEARSLLDAVITTARNGRSLHALQATVLRALTLRNTELAFQSLEDALAQAEPEGFVRLFVDEGDAMRRLLERYVSSRPSSTLRPYAARLLRAFAGLNATAASGEMPLDEPLSERELEVLSLMAEGLTNTDIANRLYLSVATVKKHGTNIFGKLNAASRQQAVERARELHLIR